MKLTCEFNAAQTTNILTMWAGVQKLEFELNNEAVKTMFECGIEDIERKVIQISYNTEKNEYGIYLFIVDGGDPFEFIIEREYFYSVLGMVEILDYDYSNEYDYITINFFETI